MLDFEDIIRTNIDKELALLLSKDKIEHVKKWVIIACVKGLNYIERMCKLIFYQSNRQIALSICKILKAVIEFEKPRLDVLDERGEKWA